MQAIRKVVRKLNEIGFAATVVLILKFIRNHARELWLKIRWRLYRMSHKEYFQERPSAAVQQTYALEIRKKEERIQEILSQNKGKSFLEIGIGPAPDPERLRLISQSGIRYTGCDFKHVCARHENIILNAKDLNLDSFRYMPNESGTYSWPLFELLQAGEAFDIIYHDGHHTFYIDLPAIVLGHFLLKPGGLFLVDDIPFTLVMMKNQLVSMYSQWNFFRNIYDFSEYSLEQQTQRHMEMIAEVILMKNFGYTKVEEFSTPDWWALRKPSVAIREPAERFQAIRPGVDGT